MPLYICGMSFRKKSPIEKYLLKKRDKESYRDYKFLLKLSQLPEFNLNYPVKESYAFKHSGNAGDIIYSLPAIYTLSANAAARLFLQVNRPAFYSKWPHPLGNVMLNEKMVEMLRPLLLAQPAIKTCEMYDGKSAIDFDLDLVRTYPLPLDKGNIARWYFYIFGITADLSKPWMDVMPDASFSDCIVVARSQRYRAPGIDYSFLQKHKTVFLGVEEEWKEMRQMLPNVGFHRVENFLEMAQLIAGCRLFIGNQSFPFSLAEALKVNRILELYHFSPNVILEGPNGADFYFQPQFEKLVQAALLQR